MTIEIAQRRYHRYALAAGACAVTPFLWVTPVLGLLMGVLARRAIKRTPDQYKGMWLANLGIGAGTLLIAMAVLYVVLKVVQAAACPHGGCLSR